MSTSTKYQDDGKRILFRRAQVALAKKMLRQAQNPPPLRRRVIALLFRHFPEAVPTATESRTTIAEAEVIRNLTSDELAQYDEVEKGIRTGRYFLRKAYERLIAAKNLERTK